MRYFAGIATYGVYLSFGSRAKGTSHAGSDIDLAMDGEDITFGQQLDINNRIDDLRFIYKVDLLNYQKQKGLLSGNISTE